MSLQCKQQTCDEHALGSVLRAHCGLAHSSWLLAASDSCSWVEGQAEGGTGEGTGCDACEFSDLTGSQGIVDCDTAYTQVDSISECPAGGTLCRWTQSSGFGKYIACCAPEVGESPVESHAESSAVSSNVPCTQFFAGADGDFSDVSDLWSCPAPCADGLIDDKMKGIFGGADNATRVGIPDGFPEFLADFSGDEDAGDDVVAVFEDFMGSAVSNLVSAGICATLVLSGEDLMEMGARQPVLHC